MSPPPAVRHVHSRDNPDYRLSLRLARGKPARRDGRVLLEGLHLCDAWLTHQGLPGLMLAGETDLATPAVQALWQTAAEASRVILADALAHALSQVHEGSAVFFVVEPPRPPLPNRIAQTCLWLDRVQDPGNLGTLLRTAAAAGLRQAFLSAGCAAAWSPKALRGGQGAHFALQVYEKVDLASLLPHLEIPLAATTLEAGSDLYAQDLRPDCVWLFGNEGQGVLPELMRRAQWRLTIPQDAGVESLNVAAAAAVCLFEQRRQRRGGPAP
ncbi:TrmH family RNA methyltransferase [Castellaniella sp.]|uniref:TrmH family RNA methyltransferase n=1 Tax=Castellaniella sp. TaxID=1955812 RepID=UPI00356258F3